jgi:hypothetical protein
MAERPLRSRSRTRDEDSSDSVSNMNFTRDNIIVKSEANSTVKANPVMEVNTQNTEVAVFNSDNATISYITTSPLQDLFATVMTAIQTESNKRLHFKLKWLNRLKPPNYYLNKKIKNLLPV